MARAPSVAIVGAGVGGLAAASRLARAGWRVDVFEKTGAPGGRCGRLEAGGFAWDIGPTIVLMPEVFEAHFSHHGRALADYLTLLRCDPNYRLHYRDGSSLTFTSELTAMGRELERVEPGSFPRYLDFLALGRRQYRTALDHLVGRNFDGLQDYLHPRTLARVLGVRAHRRMWPLVAGYFQDERLRQALTFQTMYLGVSPYASPSVYGLLPFTELGVGIWCPRGGVYAIPLALERLAREEGARLHYRAPVRRIVTEAGRARGLELEDGTRVEADAVLCNADLPYAYERLLDPEATRLPRAQRLRYTSSGYLLYLGLRRRVDALGHHTVVFGHDYRGSFEALFERGEVPRDPSFYLCAPSRTDPALAPEGKDALYVLVPVPHQNPRLDWREEGPRVREKVFRRLRELGLGQVEDSIEVEREATPDTWASTFNLARGSAFGLAQNFAQIGPFRPRNQDARVRNLFFVGASTQPGTGLPTVVISARLAEERMARWAREAGFATERAVPSASSEEVAA